MRRTGLLYRLVLLKEKINCVHVTCCCLHVCGSKAVGWGLFPSSKKFIEFIFYSIKFFFEKLESL